jgi:hypothetical protein
MQERTLNPRVRGSSPWRRTRTGAPVLAWDLAIPGHFYGPVCPGFPPVLAPCLLAGQMLVLVGFAGLGPIGLDQPPGLLQSDWSWAGVSRRRPEVESTIVVPNRDDTGRRRTPRHSMVGTAAVRGGDAAPDKSLGSKPTFPV